MKKKLNLKMSSYNELSFDDKANEEEVYLRAENDLRMKIRHDFVSEIKNNYHQIVKDDVFVRVKQDHIKQ